ncbi:uncharacterized protein PHALS_15051 [Plasmopara halstedii]|uniref:Uncharacterized protein n=1 Tax=Plasmopara halstedii TaxID=4781 RepID=A0A0P1B1L0_PLAHL|nr:uncharacterized protein PHALS_15051 [Plasmopara halstedii]CEG47698.1 hypothetical protein PHALS_15051 [Plasmopara halstedii]|eukprot:XP_024584067.1 hypothetical protein PHALS_15051 [Plasmopara halstedii]
MRHFFKISNTFQLRKICWYQSLNYRIREQAAQVGHGLLLQLPSAAYYIMIFHRGTPSLCFKIWLKVRINNSRRPVQTKT